MVYGVGFIWIFWVMPKTIVELLASSEWSLVYGCSALLNVAFMEEEEQSEFRGYRENYA